MGMVSHFNTADAQFTPFHLPVVYTSHISHLYVSLKIQHLLYKQVVSFTLQSIENTISLLEGDELGNWLCL